jgi:hypothetical protein
MQSGEPGGDATVEEKCWTMRLKMEGPSLGKSGWEKENDVLT